MNNARIVIHDKKFRLIDEDGKLHYLPWRVTIFSAFGASLETASRNHNKALYAPQQQSQSNGK